MVYETGAFILKYVEGAGNPAVICSSFQITVDERQLPHAQRGFHLDFERHLGLANAPVFEIDRDLGVAEAHPVRNVGGFNLEDISV